MKPILIVIAVLFMDGIQDLGKIGKINQYKKLAQNAFENKNYKEAEHYFKYLTDTLKVQEDEVVINLGHTYLQLNESESAAQCYEKILSSKNKKNASIAANQLGVLSFNQNQDKDKAKSLFKEALRYDSENEKARHNLEWISKLRDQDPKNQQNKNQDKNENKDQKEQQKDKGNQKDQQEKGNKDSKKDDKTKDGQKDDGNKNGNEGKDGKGNDKKPDSNKEDKKDASNDNKGNHNKDEKDRKNSNQNDKDKSGEKGNEKDKNKPGQPQENKPTQGKDDQTQAQKGGKDRKEQLVANPEVLTKMGMTDQRAKALLDAMKAGEVQYIQQMKKDSEKPKKSKNKPDW